MIDIHTHILPAIDDGPTTMTESLEMCRIAVNDGIKKMIATPHVQNGMYDLDANKVLEKIHLLNQLVKQEGLDLVIFPGAEVHLSDRLLDAEILKESSILTLNGGRNSHFSGFLQEQSMLYLNYGRWDLLQFYLILKGILKSSVTLQ